jgi:hypothetical protein
VVLHHCREIHLELFEQLFFGCEGLEIMVDQINDLVGGESDALLFVEVAEDGHVLADAVKFAGL